jgi:hypothetical protein
MLHVPQSRPWPQRLFLGATRGPTDSSWPRNDKADDHRWQATIARASPEGPVRAIGTRLQSYFYARIGPIHAAGRAPSSEDKSMAPIPRAGEHCSAVGE